MVPDLQERKYSYAFVKICLAFINENIFTNKYLVSNIRVVVVRGTRNMIDGKKERKRESERKKKRMNEEREKRKEGKEKGSKKPHLPFPKTT